MSAITARSIHGAALGLCAILIFAGRPARADDALSVVKDGKTPPLMNALNLIAEGAGFYREERLQVTTVATDGPVEARCGAGPFVPGRTRAPDPRATTTVS